MTTPPPEPTGGTGDAGGAPSPPPTRRPTPSSEWAAQQPPPPSYPQHPYAPHPPGPVAPPPYGGYGLPRSGSAPMAVWAFVSSLVGLACCPFVFSITGIVLGYLARRDIDASGGVQGGRGLAQAALWIGVVGIVVNVGYAALVLAEVVPSPFPFPTR